jgi:hypothetical protein
MMGKDKLLDFDVFHLAGTLSVDGRLTSAYDAETFLALQAERPGANGTRLPWIYPPPYALVTYALGLVPAWLAYSLFMASTLTCFLLLMRQLSGTGWATVLVFGAATARATLSALFSPYTYDYDLVVLLVAAALMLEPLNARATAIEKTLIWAGFWVLGS